jgi:uncharacterized metal-binding protein YceD (DUF177 family)
VKYLREYEIAHQGLRLGKHNFDFKIDESFFANFEDTETFNCNIIVGVELDKRENMLEFNFAINGTVLTPCDRCLKEINLPVANEYRLFIKFDDQLASITNQNEDMDMVFLPKSETVIHLETYLYEFIVLSVPYKAACPFNEGPNENCDMKVINELNKYLIDEEQVIDPRWEALRKLKE